MSQNTSTPITITRSDIGQTFGFIGALSVLLGILGLLWQRGFTLAIVVLFFVGIIGLVLWWVISPREFVNFITGRQARYSTTAFFSTLLLLGIVVMGYIILERSALSADMTEGKRFTLSDTTLEVLNNIQREVRITGFYSPRALQQREVDDQFFRLYEQASNGFVTRNYVDPVAQPGIADDFQANDGDVFISFLGINGDVDMSTVQYVTRSSRQERDITEAISRLLLSGNYVIYFDIGLGELNVTDTSQRGISDINDVIRAYGLITQGLNLEELAASGALIPEDASAVVLARPDVDPSPQALTVLDEYMRRGGDLFIAADTQTDFMRPNSLFNDYMWQNYGLRMLDAIVVDAIASDETQLDIFSYAISDLEITRSIDPGTDPNTATKFRVARAIDVNTEPPVSNGSAIRSSENSYGETDVTTLAQSNTYTYDDGVDIPGPLTTVAWARNEANGANIVLVGDSDFLTNGQVGTPPGNASLFADSLLWMTGAGAAVTFSFETTVTGQPLIFVDSRTLDFIVVITILVMPGITLALGAIVWLRRMRR